MCACASARVCLSGRGGGGQAVYPGENSYRHLEVYTHPPPLLSPPQPLSPKYHQPSFRTPVVLITPSLQSHTHAYTLTRTHKHTRTHAHTTLKLSHLSLLHCSLPRSHTRTYKDTNTYTQPSPLPHNHPPPLSHASKTQICRAQTRPSLSNTRPPTHSNLLRANAHARPRTIANTRTRHRCW